MQRTDPALLHHMAQHQGSRTDTVLLFVYGTLKAGYHNHHLLVNAQLVGRARLTDPEWILVDAGIPFLVPGPNTGNRVSGELYRVPVADMMAVDWLEGVRPGVTGRYERWHTTVELDADGSLHGCYVYACPRGAGLHGGFRTYEYRHRYDRATPYTQATPRSRKAAHR